MAKQITVSPRASQDIDEQFEYLAKEDVDIALRFFDAVRQTLAQLARLPGMGKPYHLDDPRLEGLRKWPVKGFDKHLIFYLTGENEILVVRVLHASRDIPEVLEERT